MERIVYETDGSLEIFRSGVVRTDFCRAHGVIETLAQCKATLRAGETAWPGGYPRYLITADGQALSYAAARENFREIVSAFIEPDYSPSGDWRIIGSDINWEDADLVCVHTGEKIASAYADEESPDGE